MGSITSLHLPQVYQDLCKKHTTFRERSENVDIAVEVSLQPWRAFQPDGVILFSDILTPITGMNIPFDITAGKGPVIFDPIRTMEVSTCFVVLWFSFHEPEPFFFFNGSGSSGIYFPRCCNV